MHKNINRIVGDNLMIKLIIFDQDGTLYKKDNELMLYTRKITKKWLMKRLSLSKMEVEKLYEELPKKFPNPYLGFMSLGLKVEDYMNEVFDQIAPEKFLEYNENVYQFFKNNKIPKALVTFASPTYTKKLQKVLKVYDYYSKIIFGKDLKTYSKGEAYAELINLFKLKCNEVCVVGDDYENDIKPALALGCKTVWITKKCVYSCETYAQDIDEFINKKLEMVLYE